MSSGIIVDYALITLLIIIFGWFRYTKNKKYVRVKSIVYFVLVISSLIAAYTISDNNTNIAFAMTVGVCCIEGLDNFFAWAESTEEVTRSS